jgi:phage terminase large subunit-like protein
MQGKSMFSLHLSPARLKFFRPGMQTSSSMPNDHTWFNQMPPECSINPMDSMSDACALFYGENK